MPETPEWQAGNAGVNGDFRGHPTVLLLHGLGDDETIWTRATNVERYATARGLAVLMPNVDRSFYANMHAGYRYWDFVRGELLDKARRFFPQLAASGAPRPHIYQCCGAEDFLLAQNRAFHAHLDSLGVAHEYDESPGDHDWAYWDKTIDQTLGFLARGRIADRPGTGSGS